MTRGRADIPVIETERLILRGWREDDFDGLFALLGDAKVTRFVGGTKDEPATWRQLATYAGHWMLKGWGPFAVTLKSTGETIGYCGPWDPVGKALEPEITYGFAAAHHGRGYATEAVHAALDHVYVTLDWATAISYIDAQNTASLGVARKLGARHDGDAMLYDVVPVQIWRYPAASALAADEGRAA